MMLKPLASPARTAGDPITFAKVTKTYGKTIVVDEFDLDIAAGEFVSLLGPSGSGKTTTLMMLAGFADPYQGDIRIGGKSIKDIPADRRGIGMVFQSYALFPHMNVTENISFPLRMRNAAEDEIRRQCGRIIELVGLAGMERRYPRQLSGGQQQRVALARALVFNPTVLLLDEPLGALDKLLRDRMQLELRRIHQELGTTMIYVTHDQDEALVLSDRIAIMKDGRLSQCGAPEDVYRKPANAFVAGFIGGGNFLAGKTGGRDGAFTRVETGGGSLLGLCPRPIAAQEPCQIFIRREHLELHRSPDQSSNQVSGTVTDVIFHGDLKSVHVRINAQCNLVLTTSGDTVVERGKLVQVSARPENSLIFAADAARQIA